MWLSPLFTCHVMRCESPDDSSPAWIRILLTIMLLFSFVQFYSSRLLLQYAISGTYLVSDYTWFSRFVPPLLMLILLCDPHVSLFCPLLLTDCSSVHHMWSCEQEFSSLSFVLLIVCRLFRSSLSLSLSFRFTCSLLVEEDRRKILSCRHRVCLKWSSSQWAVNVKLLLEKRGNEWASGEFEENNKKTNRREERTG